MATISEGPWLSAGSPESDVIASSRVRFARNLSGFPFVSRATSIQRQQIFALVRRASLPESVAPGIAWLDLAATAPRERALLVERHLISRQFAEGDAPRGVGISADELVSVMVNEEDHLRLQVLLPGLQLEDALRRADAIDDALESTLDYAFSQRWGYLTACPTNVGCGIRISVMAHLPAMRITGEIERFKRAAKELSLAVRGFFGEGSDNAGDFFQISNQTTLGIAEQDLLCVFRERMISSLLGYERAARRMLQQQPRAPIDDRIFRDVAVLRSARLLKLEETMRMLSHARLGVLLGRVADVELPAINRLLLQVHPAHLQASVGRDLSASEQREVRADLVRATLGA